MPSDAVDREAIHRAEPQRGSPPRPTPDTGVRVAGVGQEDPVGTSAQPDSSRAPNTQCRKGPIYFSLGAHLGHKPGASRPQCRPLRVSSSSPRRTRWRTRCQESHRCRGGGLLAHALLLPLAEGRPPSKVPPSRVPPLRWPSPIHRRAVAQARRPAASRTSSGVCATARIRTASCA